ncbi:hypothetical protein HY492_01195 [Candidatus Woesearchaeota archaeon]|nr:hypothetical protein [Candidatus Woesearchaeota archaeon]
MPHTTSLDTFLADIMLDAKGHDGILHVAPFTVTSRSTDKLVATALAYRGRKQAHFIYGHEVDHQDHVCLDFEDNDLYHTIDEAIAHAGLKATRAERTYTLTNPRAAHNGAKRIPADHVIGALNLKGKLAEDVLSIAKSYTEKEIIGLAAINLRMPEYEVKERLSSYVPD